MKKLFILALLICSEIIISNIIYANDCNNTFKKCKNPDKTYRISPSSRSIKMRKGKKTRITLNAYAGKKYYFSTYSKGKVGVLQFRILNTSNNKILYDNATEGLIDYKFFKVENTQKLLIEVMAPNWRSNNTFECVGVKIAYKK
jgi:hypothetical protein